MAAGCVGPGRQPEMEARACEPEIGQRGDRNRRFPEKPLINPCMLFQAMWLQSKGQALNLRSLTFYKKY